jgi:hypothetical protein
MSGRASSDSADERTKEAGQALLQLGRGRHKPAVNGNSSQRWLPEAVAEAREPQIVPLHSRI